MTDDRSKTSTALLREEHELILQVAEALRTIVDGRELDHDNVERCITFLRLYADACHHGKEEDLLFPSLEASGLPRDGGPVAVMLMEHDEGRVLVRDMAGAAPAARDGDEAAADVVRAASQGFVELITAHISKENLILFDMADRLIEGSDLQALLAAYGALSEERYEGHSKSELEELAHRILGVGA